jgi:hypothetical protein
MSAHFLLQPRWIDMQADQLRRPVGGIGAGYGNRRDHTILTISGAPKWPDQELQTRGDIVLSNVNHWLRYWLRASA